MWHSLHTGCSQQLRCTAASMRHDDDRIWIRLLASILSIAFLLAHLLVDSLRDASDNCSANWASRNLVNSSAEDKACTIKAEMCVPTRHHLSRNRGDQTDHALTGLFGLEHIVAVVFLLFLLVVLFAAHGVVWHVCLDDRRRNNHLLGGPAGR